MASGSSYTNTFGGGTINPAQPSYSALTISASTALVWPLESTGGTPYVAAQIDVTATAAGLQLQMPPGNTGSNGAQTLLTNAGTNTFTLTDQAGNSITPVAATQTWLITLTSNGTANGTWRAYQIGSTVSQATAAALAGSGLQASGSQLQVNWPTVALSSNTTVTPSYRSTAIVWTGGTGTLQYNPSATLGYGWVGAVTNEGTGPLTLAGTGGETFNGAGTLVLQPGNGGIIICQAGGFNSFGALITALSIPNGGTGAQTAAGALTNFGGTSIGQSIFTAPSKAAVLSILNLNNIAFVESTVAVNQVLSASSTNTMFVCSSGLTITLPPTTTLTKTFVFAALAQGGPVVLVPQASDAIAGQSVAANYNLSQGQSGLFMTDTAGNWWPILSSASPSSGLLASLGDIKDTSLPPAVISTAAPGWHLCSGGTRPRTDPLWQATGAVNPAYWVWGTGDGSTTYTLPDLRGRSTFGEDDMGGSAASRITGASGIAGTTLGAAGGNQLAQQDTITIATSGAITAASSATSTVTDPQHSHAPPSNQFILSGAGSAGVAGGVGFNQAATTANATTGITVATSVTTTITNGQTITATSGLTGTSQNMPPAAIVNKIIYCGA